MPLISVVINLDSRPERLSEDGLFNGCVSRDFIIDSVINKINFFKDFPDKEVIVHVDRHEHLDESTLVELQKIADTVIIRKHTDEKSFNDWSYIRALKLAAGDYIAHFDQDCCAFTGTSETIKATMTIADHFPFVSYPSDCSPNPVDDSSFNRKFWASTRYFFCRRERLDFNEIEKCLKDYDYWVETYKPARACHWFEHICSSIHNFDVYYPPMDLDNYAVFCWDNYRKGLLAELNAMSYEQVKEFIIKHNNIHYPCNLTV